MRLRNVNVEFKLRVGIDDPKREDAVLPHFDDAMRKICDSSPHQSMCMEKGMAENLRFLPSSKHAHGEGHGQAIEYNAMLEWCPPQNERDERKCMIVLAENCARPVCFRCRSCDQKSWWTSDIPQK